MAKPNILTEQEKAEIQTQWIRNQNLPHNKRVTQHQLATRYKVNQSTIARLVTGLPRISNKEASINLHSANYTNGEIATTLGISERTVVDYLKGQPKKPNVGSGTGKKFDSRMLDEDVARAFGYDLNDPRVKGFLSGHHKAEKRQHFHEVKTFSEAAKEEAAEHGALTARSMKGLRGISSRYQTAQDFSKIMAEQDREREKQLEKVAARTSDDRLKSLLSIPENDLNFLLKKGKLTDQEISFLLSPKVGRLVKLNNGKVVVRSEWEKLAVAQGPTTTKVEQLDYEKTLEHRQPAKRIREDEPTRKTEKELFKKISKGSLPGEVAQKMVKGRDF